MTFRTRFFTATCAGIALPLLLLSCHVSVPVGTNSTPFGAPACQQTMSATASARGQTQGPVEVTARLKWRDAVRDAHGFAYSHWDNAHGQDMTCNRSGGVIATWTCTATAEPCLG
jgi:hypothetical protein